MRLAAAHPMTGFFQAVLLAYSSVAFTAGAATQLVVWGNNPGETPSSLGEIVAMTGGSVHSVVLDVNGRVTAWGADYNGETDVPSNLGAVSAISAGDAHTLALRWNATVAAWGFNGALQCQVPPTLRDVAAVVGFRRFRRFL